MFCTVFVLSVYFISNVYFKYSATPMIISLNSESTDIRKLPFPGKLKLMAILFFKKKYNIFNEFYFHSSCYSV